MTPGELVATYDNLADVILAVKQTEANLVRLILGSTYAHARVERDRARRALEPGDTATARASLENREGKLFDVTKDAGPGFQLVQSSRGLAVGDYDNDGDPDLLISNQDVPPNLLRNETPDGAWLTIELEVPNGEPTPFGATVTLTADGRTLRRDLFAATSHMSTHDPRLHFGLGEAVRVDKIDVRWPDGTHSNRPNVAVNQFLRIRKGS